MTPQSQGTGFPNGEPQMKAEWKLRIITGRLAAFSSTSHHLPKREILCLTRAASLQNRLRQKRCNSESCGDSGSDFHPILPHPHVWNSALGGSTMSSRRVFGTALREMLLGRTVLVENHERLPAGSSILLKNHPLVMRRVFIWQWPCVIFPWC